MGANIYVSYQVIRNPLSSFFMQKKLAQKYHRGCVYGRGKVCDFFYTATHFLSQGSFLFWILLKPMNMLVVICWLPKIVSIVKGEQVAYVALVRKIDWRKLGMVSTGYKKTRCLLVLAQNCCIFLALLVFTPFVLLLLLVAVFLFTLAHSVRKVQIV